MNTDILFFVPTSIMFGIAAVLLLLAIAKSVLFPNDKDDNQ